MQLVKIASEEFNEKKNHIELQFIEMQEGEFNCHYCCYSFFKLIAVQCRPLLNLSETATALY